MLLRKSGSLESTLRSSDITPQHLYNQYKEQHQTNRRRFLAAAATIGATALAARYIPGVINPETTVHAADQLTVVPSKYNLDDPQTPLAKASNYNNFYEFGTDKPDPAHNAGKLKTHPWPIQITGMVKKPQTTSIDDLIHYRPLESRVYRLRCVEAWSMVIPWDGYSLSEFINFCEPLPSAKYIQFFSAVDKKAMRTPLRLRLALHGRPAHGRGYEPPHPPHLRLLWPDAAQPERRSHSHHRALEVRLQIRKIHRPLPLH